MAALATQEPAGGTDRTRSPFTGGYTDALEAPLYVMAVVQRVQAFKVDLAAALAGTPYESLTLGQIHMLMALGKHAPCNQTRIVEVSGMDRSTLADVMRRLKGKKLIERKRTKEDARSYAVTLTEAGRKALSSAKPIVQKIDKKLRVQILESLRLA
jgi:DNA-binding MarR family transcriptional regulator